MKVIITKIRTTAVVLAAVLVVGACVNGVSPAETAKKVSASKPSLLNSPDIKASGVTDVRATITWTTKIPGTSRVEYGKGINYGKTGPVDGLPRLNHFVTLTGLSAGTTYHYRVLTKDIYDKVLASGDYTFTTLKKPPAGKNYYVSPKGDDGNSGLKPEKPWKHPSYAAQKAKAGDTIYLMDGTWENEPTIKFAHSGTAAQPITLIAYPGAKPILDGGIAPNLKVKARSAIDTNYQSYIHIDGISITRYAPGIWMSYDASRHSHHIKITNCDIGHCGSSFIHINYCSYVILDNCVMHDLYPRGPFGGWNSVQVQGRQVFRNGKPQPYLISHHISITNNKIYNNTTHNGIDLNGTMYNLDVVGNEIYNHRGCQGIFVHSVSPTNPDGYLGLNRYSNISNNRIYKCLRGIASGFNDSYYCNNVIDNLVRHNYGIYTGDGHESNMVYYRNRCYGNAGVIDVNVARIGSRLSGPLKAPIKMPGIGYGPNARVVHNRYILEENDIPSYIVRAGKVVIRNPARRSFRIESIAQAPVRVEFTDGRVFGYRVTVNNGGTFGKPAWTPAAGGFSIKDGKSPGSIAVVVTTYPMTAVPAAGTASIKVKKFDASSKGVIADFTASTKDGNEVTFIVNDLKPGKEYVVKRAGKVIASKKADNSVKIEFANSRWPKAQRFTIE